jgi:DNA-damage-inducible protein J
MNANTNINIRTTNEIKSNANEVLKALGLDISTAVNMFLIQVAEKKAIPFSLSVTVPKKQAKIGGWEGKGWISDEFDEEMDTYGQFASNPDFGKPVREPWEE